MGCTPATASEVTTFLAPLLIDDVRPVPVRYDCEDWAGWSDTDDDGCDGRQQPLVVPSIAPAKVDRFDGTVIAGDWFPAYVGLVTADPSDLDVDHLVSLSDAHRAGGGQWTAPWRREFTNDRLNLLVVSASANRSKDDDGPHRWRPQRREAWGDYAAMLAGFSALPPPRSVP